MLKIRLQRVGRKNLPSFRVVLTDSRNSTKSGKFLEVLGFYDPVNNVKEIKPDRIEYWISQGAQVSDTVHNFLIDKGVVKGKKINVLPKKSPVVSEEVEKAKSESAPEKQAPKPTVDSSKGEAIEKEGTSLQAETIAKEKPVDEEKKEVSATV